MTAPQLPAEVRALLAERRARTYGQARLEASTRRAAWRIIRDRRSVPRDRHHLTDPGRRAHGAAARNPEEN